MQRSLLMTALGAAVFAAFPIAAVAQGTTGRPAANPAPAVETAIASGATVRVDSASPRAAVQGFLIATRAGDFGAAAEALDRDAVPAGRGSDLARRLKSVLDAHLWVDLDRVSPFASGDTADGLPRDRELLGEVPDGSGRLQPVRLARVERDGATRWVFSEATIREIDSWYATLPDNWVREHLPEALLANGPFDVLWWQWIALLTLIPLAIVIGLVFAAPTQSLLRRVVSKTSNEFDDALVSAAWGPIVLLWAMASSRILLRWVALAAPAQAFVVGLQKSLAIVAAFWIILRSITVLQDALPVSAWASRHPALRSLIPLGGRITRVLVFALGILTLVASFGYPVATILAGLGIGGIAVALGAQKSLEHFFGSLSIGVDQPFRVGDWVKVDGVEGGVEAIGLRSTRIRTLDHTVVSIPNGRLAEAPAENFGERERIRLRAMLGLEYGTSSATMRVVRDAIEARLRAHPKTWPDRVVVRFNQFSASSLDLELFCWIETTDIDEFRAIREELFLAIMEIVESSGASFAYPTSTVMLRTETVESRKSKVERLSS